jgi:queuine tRNA-ribosyltransferase
MTEFRFDLEGKHKRARAGTFETPHGPLRTPVFAPVGTQATVKSLTPDQLEELGSSMLLTNTYHLYLRPGNEIVKQLGGVHQFMNWDGPILSDSGGFQVFSLSKTRQVDREGVTFFSHIDGSEHRFTPEKVIAIQEDLGADIIMVLDECTAPYDRDYNRLALERTHHWAEGCLAAKTRPDQALFGIVQGGVFPDLRAQSAAFLSELEFPGYAVGGLSVGETKDEMYEILDLLDPLLPIDKPRYLMGVGSPDDLVEAVLRGVDIFDCVLPTRLARNHAALTRRGRMNMRKAIFTTDPRPIDPECKCYTCVSFSRSYVRHLATAGEMLAATLLSIHNISTLIELVNDLRAAILDGTLETLVEDFRSNYQKHRPPEL